MAAEPSYVDYVRLSCRRHEVGSETNLFASLHCAQCKWSIQDLSGMINHIESASSYIKWGGSLTKKVTAKNGGEVRIKDLTSVRLALANGVKIDRRFAPGTSLTLEDLQEMFREDTSLFLIRSGWYQPEHLILIKQHDPELWRKILELSVRYGVIQNLPLDNDTVSYIRNNTDSSLLQSGNFLTKLKKYRAIGLLTDKICEGLITADQTRLLIELSLSMTRPYARAMFGEVGPENIGSCFNALINEKSLSHWLIKIHEIRAIPLFEKIPQDYKLDEDSTWKNYPVFEVYIFVDKLRKRVSGGLLHSLYTQPNPNVSRSQQSKLLENWQKCRTRLDIALESPPMTATHFRKFILVKMIGEIRTEIQQYETEKSVEYICSGKPI